MTHFNKLTPGELERLVILAEECNEVGQAVMKIVRHGWEERHPTKDRYVDNRDELEKELGDVQAAIQRMINALDIDPARVRAYRLAKLRSKKYLHHQMVSTEHGIDD